jgi:hypothetical protein
LIRNFVPGLVFEGTFRESRFLPSGVSTGTSVPRRKSKKGTDLRTVTSGDSSEASVRLLAVERPKGSSPRPEAPKRSEKSNVWKFAFRERPAAPEKFQNKSSNPDAEKPDAPQNPWAPAIQNASYSFRFFGFESTS